jgi:hypothetical protein
MLHIFVWTESEEPFPFTGWAVGRVTQFCWPPCPSGDDKMRHFLSSRWTRRPCVVSLSDVLHARLSIRAPCPFAWLFLLDAAVFFNICHVTRHTHIYVLCVCVLKKVTSWRTRRVCCATRTFCNFVLFVSFQFLTAASMKIVFWGAV